jgi:hypothetical protein
MHMPIDLHDGYLHGIVVYGEKMLVLFCTTVNGKDCTVTIPGLVRLRANNFNEGNIIFELNFHRGSACPSDLVGKLRGYDLKDAERLSADLRNIGERNWTLLELTSSYGCDLLALFDGAPEAVQYDAGGAAMGGQSTNFGRVTD